MSSKHRIGIFICRCGTNIADKLNFDELKERIAKFPDVIGVFEDNFFCAPAGKTKIKEVVEKEKLTGCCFAACSHRVHEKTFMDTINETGLNQFMIQMANLREHITWVVNDKNEATERAYRQIKAAVARLKHQVELEIKHIDLKTDVAIIGGGIAGIKAAKALAKDSNRTIYLIEKEATLGGWMPKWEKSYPTMDCNPCFLAPELTDMRDYKNIKVITLAEIQEIKGFYGNFNLKIKQKARYVNEGCIGCMECFNVCPVKVKNEFNSNMNYRNSIYIPFPGSYPNLALIDEKSCLRFKGEDCTKCKESCMFEAIEYNQTSLDWDISVGAVIVATGFEFIDIAEFPQYNYTGTTNIFTNFEFERMMSSSGPSHGHIKTRDDKDPQSVAIVYCGGRSKAGYCSSVCCGTSMKYAKFLLGHNPGVKIYQIYSEICLEGDGVQRMKEELEKEGVEFIKVDDYRNIKVSAAGGNTEIMYTQNNIEKKITANITVVSMGIKQSEGSRQVSKMMDLTFTKDGWFDKWHSKMEPVTSVVEGVFLAGCCSGPKDVGRSVVSAKSAVGEALSKLIPGQKIELDPKVSYSDETKCGGCKMCITVCPYKAISFDESKRVSVVSEILCKGCGTCVALCPAGALRNRHFEDEQIRIEIETLI
ncbi:CoB--CoM heterodisulfide reductase iron-sulfur subunit A family protein [Candidatus Dependentiae bacterium]|nr:CoB--CoM heterodisulfide reductase iron-sulfur subunit A family protein [Candidatus Dependentiae bacterium]